MFCNNKSVYYLLQVNSQSLTVAVFTLKSTAYDKKEEKEK